MSALLLLSVCLLLGVLMRRYGNPPATLAPSLNWWVIQIALPAMVLELIPLTVSNRGREAVLTISTDF